MNGKSDTNFIDDFLSSISESPPNSPFSDAPIFDAAPVNSDQPMMTQQQQQQHSPVTPMSPVNSYEMIYDAQPTQSVPQDRFKFFSTELP